jgi:uncharacterized membrane protein
VLRVLLAALFLVAGVLKLVGVEMEVAVFDAVGLGQWLRYATGLAEIVGAVALLIPSVSAFGALILLAVDIGAFGAQVLVLHQDWIHTVIIAVLLAALLYAQRRQILDRLGG